MSSLNKVQLIGRIGQDPEVRFLPNGDAVCNLSLATSKKWTDKSSGQKVEKTEWHRLSVFGKLAEVCGQYLKKGSLAYFEGELETRQWEKDGVKQYTTEIRVKEMTMLDGKAEGGQPSNAAPRQAAAPQQQRQAPQKAADKTDDIPF